MAELVKTLTHGQFVVPLVAALLAFYVAHKLLGG
jgi:hypothetical protein